MAQTFEYNLRRAGEIINQILYVTIASVTDDGKPWSSPVYSAFDEKLNIYWASDKNGQHSKNVRASGKAFLVIYDSTMAEGTGEGVYLQVKVDELGNSKEILDGLAVMDRRTGKTKERNYQNYTGNAALRVYRAVPQNIWINDVEEDENGQYIRDIRVEIPIDRLKAQLGFNI